MKTPLAIVLKGYPRLSETFIAQEIRSLEKHGFDITLYSLRHPTDTKTHPIHDEIVSKVVYLPEYLYQQPFRILKSLWKVRGRIHGSGVFRTWWKDVKRDKTANRIRRLGQGIVLAAELPPHMPRVYVHFMHTPASVTRYACDIRGLPWACSAHAKDIWTSPRWELEEKLAACKWLTTCTAANTEYLQQLSADPHKVKLNYHGLDLSRFPRPNPKRNEHNGGNSDQAVTILSVGRAVPKKGYENLLRSLADLPKDLHWRFIHIGGGPLLKQLKQLTQTLNIQSNIEWLGPQSQQTVLEYYGSADLFALNCRIDDDGDRDGLPNVLVEAQSQGLPVISTSISGVPELIQHNKNGILVEEGDNAQLTDALAQLITNPTIRNKMGNEGLAMVHANFSMQKNHQALFELLENL